MARRVWPGMHTPATLCLCRWNLYYASCSKAWHRELAARTDGFTALTGSPATEFPAQSWEVAP